jgi:hypothetical protein
VAKGKAAGMTLTEKYVWQVRSAAKHEGKKTKPSVKAAPAPKAAAPAVKGRQLGKSAEFVLAQDPKLSAPEIVDLAKAAGFDLTAHRIHNIRWAAKRSGKQANTSAKATATPKVAAAAAKPTKAITKTAYILDFPQGTPAAEVVAKAKAEGIKLSVGHVYSVRTAAKAKAKKAKATSASTKAVRTTAITTGVIDQAPRDRYASPSTIADINPLDLAYAVGRLVTEGKTTAAEVVQLAAERTARIMSLESELAALKGGSVPMGEMAKPVRAKKGTKPAKANKA